MNSRQLTLRDFALRVVITVLITVMIMVLVYLLWQGIRVLLEVFAGILLAILLATLARWLNKYTHLPYRWSLALVIVLLLLVFGGFGWLLANRLTKEAVELAHKLPQSLGEIQEYLTRTSWGAQMIELVSQAPKSLTWPNTFGQISGLVFGVADFSVAALVIIFVGLFGAANPQLYLGGLLHLVPSTQRERAAHVTEVIVHNLRWWLAGQICLMVLMGATAALGLWLIGLPLALVLGVIAGLMELIPYLGAWLSAVPAALVALMLGPWYLAMTVALYLCLHVLEGYVLVPLIQGQAVHLPPALILVVQVLLGALLGVLGLLVAAPLTVALVVLLKLLYVQDTLGDRNVVVEVKPAPKDV